MRKVKEHFKKYKTVYITGGSCLVIGVGVGLLVNHKPLLVNSKNQVVGLVNWKPIQTIEVFVEALGDPGNIIQDLTTGTIYASQGQAARELGVHPSMISKHLNGVRETVNGHELKKLGKAIVK